MPLSYYYVCYNSYIGKVVHHKDCRYLLKKNREFLGSFHGYSQAVLTAQQRDPETDQCQACLELRHKTDVSKKKTANTTMRSVSKLKISESLRHASGLKEKKASYINRVPRKHSRSVLESEHNEDE